MHVQALTTANDRCRQSSGPVDHKDQKRIARRFFERLEQAVGGTVGHGVRRLDNSNFPTPFVASEIEFVHELTNLFDTDSKFLLRTGYPA